MQYTIGFDFFLYFSHGIDVDKIKKAPNLGA
jgi:hypothetical protein